MKINKWIINGSKPFQGWTQSYLNENGLTPYDGLTFDQYNEKNGGVMKLITDSELDELLAKHKQDMISDWLEVDEDRYYEMLEVLPPIYRGIAFFVSEATYDSLHTCLIKWKGKFYESTQCRRSTEKHLVESLINQIND
tara:strand:+ start:1867 stop:2283 length:417 start_codon:yes stop_codon:yes gene_type:complete